MLLSSPPIQRSKSLQEQTYQALRGSILAGELAPGDRLVETQLAQQLQVSRTPIREALRQLQQEGLILTDATGNLRVTTLSVEDALQLYDCRIALEQLSVAGACAKATASQLQLLEQYVLEAEAMQQSSNDRQRLDLDYQFHRLIAESSGNKWLVSLLEQVFDRMMLLRIQTTRHNAKVLEIRTEHRQIYEAIATRNPKVATNAIVTHLRAASARVAREVEREN